MKILDIKLSNLNSLRGEWHIDLNDKVYSSSGIFAITGPTGAGKTTIFDAICLALYGRTSRLTKVSKSTNEIISIGENKCSAQVTFETEKGKFTCKWRQTRKDGELQQPEHYLWDGNTSKLLTSKIQQTQQEIIRLTGMDFMRFTRAMMLEQGNFDKFLKADKNERAEILEMITGTEIYSEISRRVFKRSQDETSSLRDIKLRLGENEALIQSESDEEIYAMLEKKRAEFSELDSQHSQTRTQHEFLREIHKLEEELRIKEDEITRQILRLDEFTHERKILDDAERAQALMIDYSQIKNLRQSRDKSLSVCERLSRDIQITQDLIARIDEELPKTQEEFMRLKGNIDASPDTIREKIKSLVENYKKAESEKQRLKDEGCKAKKKFETLQADSERKDKIREFARKKVDEASKLYQEILDALMKSRARTVSAVLEEERIKLMPGQPCPLCGAVEHPGLEHSHKVKDKEKMKTPEELFMLSEKLDERLKLADSEVDRLRKEHDNAEQEYQNAQTIEATAKNELERLRTDWQAKNEECKKLLDEVMKALMPLNLPDINNINNVIARVNEWAEKLNSLDKEIQNAENKRLEYSTRRETLKNNLAPEYENLEAISLQLKAGENDFIVKLTAQNFEDEKSFVAACLEQESLTALQRKRDELNTRMNELMTLRDNISKKLEEKRSQAPENIKLKEAEAKFTDEEKKLKALSGDIAILTQKLNDIKALQGKIEDLKQELEAQEIKAEKWANLNNFIGSASGDKLRVFAQKITLGLVVENANLYLQKMNGRYRLKVNQKSEKLELSVIDNEQAGEIRPTENLSGGERFIISLALALGLSQISGSKARVDSLFLDEGFGSLDDDALNTALDALGEVKREGRMIGIISHVQALKERIAAQIQVIPKSEGMSIIEGAGCYKL